MATLQEWKDKAQGADRQKLLDLLVSEERTGPWQVVSALLLLALQDDIIGEEQLHQGIDAAMLILAMNDPEGFDEITFELEAEAVPSE